MQVADGQSSTASLSSLVSPGHIPDPQTCLSLGRLHGLQELSLEEVQPEPAYGALATWLFVA